MGVQSGMRGTDLQKFLMVAREFNVIILVRHTNPDSLKYVGQPGFYPKPAIVKAKTADVNPPPLRRFVNGKVEAKTYEVAGLVVHPDFQPNAFAGAKQQKAKGFWNQTMHYLSPTLENGRRVDLEKPETWSIWGVDRVAHSSGRWHWRVDIDPKSAQFGCLQLKQGAGPWCYIHGDYDLKDVIVLGRETDNRRNEGQLDGVKNYTPSLHKLDFERVRTALNERMGVDMVQHGAEAQFAWHGDEPITVAFPDWRTLILYDAVTVQSWYRDLNRELLANKGADYLKDRSRMFHFGPEGIFAPGAIPAHSWDK